MIIISRFPMNLVGIHLIDLNQRSINFNILFFIIKNSSNTINCNWSYFLIKLSNHFEFNDGKSLQLNGIVRFEWIIIPSMLNVVFLIYAMNKTFFLKGLNEDVYYKKYQSLVLNHKCESFTYISTSKNE